MSTRNNIISEIIRKHIQYYCTSIVDVLRAIEAKYGEEGKKAAKEGFLTRLKEKAKEMEKDGGKGDVQSFCADLEKAAAETHEWKRVVDEKNKVAYHFTKCMYAEEFLKIDAADIGEWLCGADEPAAKAVKLKFKRSKTLMQGDEICDHIFYVDEH